MKTTTRAAILGILLGTATCHQLHAQGTALGYQGVLNSNGVPATGLYDFQFYLRDALTVGSPVGSPLYVVQTPGAPLLTITRIGNQAIVSWDPSVTGWTLQTNLNLATPTWGNYSGAVINNRVTNSPLNGNLFFRLKQ